MPYPVLVEAVSESFACLPREAAEAIRDDRGGLLAIVMQVRAFRGALRAYNRDGQRKANDDGHPFVDQIAELDLAYAETLMRKKEDG